MQTCLERTGSATLFTCGTGVTQSDYPWASLGAKGFGLSGLKDAFQARDPGLCPSSLLLPVSRHPDNTNSESLGRGVSVSGFLTTKLVWVQREQGEFWHQAWFWPWSRRHLPCVFQGSAPLRPVVLGHVGAGRLPERGPVWSLPCWAEVVWRG